MINLDIDDQHLHSLRMLAGAHGQTAEEYILSVLRSHCKYLKTDEDRGLAFATVEFLDYASIPELAADLLNNTMLGYDMLGGTSENSL